MKRLSLLFLLFFTASVHAQWRLVAPGVEYQRITRGNLDGGGSSALWLEDAIVNQPSDGTERKVGNHLAVVASHDYKGCSK